jgi:hypothetical protein
MESISSASEEFLVAWNLRFRYDRKWRKKYGISFGSKEHLESNQIDIFNDLAEDRLFDKLEKEYVENRKDEEDYSKSGRFLREQKLSAEQSDQVFNKLRNFFKD